MRIFKKTHRSFADTCQPIRWMTWSSETRKLIHEWAHIARLLREPHLVRFGKGEYQYSLTLAAEAQLTTLMQTKMDELVNSFQHLRVPRGITCLDQLMDKSIDTSTIRSLFAYIRDRLVTLTGDPVAAIYAPLGAVGGTAQGEFPLHSDLYPPAVLFNIFDVVPGDGSGDSLFLSVASLKRMVDKWPYARERLDDLLSGHPNEDRYEEFYNFLHGTHPWVGPIEKAMASEQIVVRLCRGQGYLVNDRMWLHGRQALTARVTSTRLHRLIFDTRTTRKIRV
jgi:hypothetical protein